MCFVRLLKHWYKEQTMQIKWGKHFSEPFHMSNGVRQGGVLSPYWSAVYLDDLSNELNNIKAGCYTGEVLDVCWWYLCVLSKCTLVAKNPRCVPGVCRIAWDYFQLQQNCLYDVFKVKSAKSTVSTLLTLGGQNVKSVNQYKYLGVVLNTGLWNDKDIQRQLRYQYCAANKLRDSVSGCSNAVKLYFFFPFVRPCMHHNYDVITGSHACRDCVWHITLDAELYTTCPGEPVLVPTRFNVTFLTLRLCYENTRTCFSKDAENVTTNGYMLWCSQIVCIRPYSLNTIIAFYSVNDWSNFAVSVWLMACHATCHNASAFYLDSTNIGIGALLRSSFVTSVTC